jgi:hypothetical protein
MAYSTDDIILWAKISQPLAAIGEYKKQATNTKAVDIDHHMKLYVERKSVAWYNGQATIDADYLYKVSNWLWALTFPYGLRAQYIDGGSGGQVTPIVPSGRPNQLNFTVDASTTPLIDGQTSVVLPQFIGYNLVLDKNGQPMTQISTAPIYYTWVKATGTLTLNQAAVTGDEFQITPV